MKLGPIEIPLRSASLAIRRRSKGAGLLDGGYVVLDLGLDPPALRVRAYCRPDDARQLCELCENADMQPIYVAGGEPYVQSGQYALESASVSYAAPNLADVSLQLREIELGPDAISWEGSPIENDWGV